MLGLFSGGILSFAFPLFGLVMLVSSLLAGPRNDPLFLALNIVAGAVFYFLSATGLLPHPLMTASPLAFLVAMSISWVLIGTAVFLSRRGPLDLIPGENLRAQFLVDQTRQLRQEIEQRRSAELAAQSRAASLLAASKMAIECATAPRGTDPA